MMINLISMGSDIGNITINAFNAIIEADIIVNYDNIDLSDLDTYIKDKEIIVNATGIYQMHSSVADCGITGRKLACDFYSTACPIGGGSPWTKDASKADLTLKLCARYLAVQNLKDNDKCFVYLFLCISVCKYY